jgi:2-dehydropantoate 2-reductase
VDKMNILIYGAGVLGSVLAVRLREAGHNVSILARGQRLADMREHGIVLQDALTGDRLTMRLNIVERLIPEDAYDLVVVVMRRNQVREVLPALAANRHTPNVLFMGNNVAGPDEYVAALGWERVLLGFAGAGGVREGEIIQYVANVGGRRATITLGEIDGSVTPRVQALARGFELARFRVVISRNMDAWLKTHAAVVVPVALALYMVGGDNYRLARTRDALVLGLRALREDLRVLRALHIPITPPAIRVCEWLPELLPVPLLRRLFDSRYAEIGMAGHANAAQDEMAALAAEFQALVCATDVPTPALDWLSRYLDPRVPPLAAGSARVALDWRSLWIMLGALTGMLALARLLRRRDQC